MKHLSQKDDQISIKFFEENINLHYRYLNVEDCFYLVKKFDITLQNNKIKRKSNLPSLVRSSKIHTA